MDKIRPYHSYSTQTNVVFLKYEKTKFNHDLVDEVADIIGGDICQVIRNVFHACLVCMTGKYENY